MSQEHETTFTSHHKIIIIEDDNDLRESLMLYLAMHGYDIIGVSSAVEFYQHITTAKYALAIVDIGLPDQDGRVLSEYLKANTDIRIIMLTARATLADKLSGYHSGADIYLVKPVDFSEIAAAIAALLIRIESLPSASLPLVKEQKTIREITVNVTPWTFMTKEWLLMTPLGSKIKLTAKEFKFLTCLISHHKNEVPRSLILKSLSYPDDVAGGAALETLVHRLRSKTDKGAPSPIRTIHGVGYSFIADIVIV